MRTMAHEEKAHAVSARAAGAQADAKPGSVRGSVDGAPVVDASESKASAPPEGMAPPVSRTSVSPESSKTSAEKKPVKRGKKPNNVRRMRIERMMSKAELSRRANLSVLTIDRVEKGFGCRMDTKRKILEALGLSLADRVRVFGEEE